MRLFFRTIGWIITITILGVAIFLLTFDINHYREKISKELSLVIGQPVTVDELGLKMSVIPTLRATGITIRDDKKQTNLLVKIKKMDFTFSLLPIFKGVFIVEDVVLDDVFILAKNLKQKKQADEKQVVENEERTERVAKNPLSRVQIKQILVKDIVARYIDREKNFAIKAPEVKMTQMQSLNAKIMHKNQLIEVFLSTNDIENILMNQGECLFNMKVKAFGTDLDVSGQIEDLATFEKSVYLIEGSTENMKEAFQKSGLNRLKMTNEPAKIKATIKGNLDKIIVESLDIKVGERSALLKLLGIAENLLGDKKIDLKGSIELNSKEIAQLYQLRPFSMYFDVQYDNPDVKLNDITLFAHKSDLKISGDLDLNKNKPFIKGSVQSRYFDLTDFLLETDVVVDEGLESQNNIKKQKKFNISKLNKINGEIKGVFENLNLFSVTTGYHNINFDAKLNDGILTINPLNVKLLDGEIHGSLNVNAEKLPVKIATDLSIDGLVISKIKTISKHLQDSVAYGDVKLSGIGNNVEELIEGLDGTLEIELTSGQIINEWFNTISSIVASSSKSKSFSYSKSDEQPSLKCAVLNLNLEKGKVVSNRNIALETSAINAVVSGDINFSKQYLNLELEPSISEIPQRSGTSIKLAEKIYFEGPFDNLKIRELGYKKKIKNSNEQGKQIKQNTGDLCRFALGHDLRKVVKKEKIVQEDLQKEKDKTRSTKEEIKERIMESLTEILKKR